LPSAPGRRPATAAAIGALEPEILANPNYAGLNQLSTRDLVNSLRRDGDAPLKYYPDGVIADGNTRAYILGQRGYPIDNLPGLLRPRSSYPAP
jgi:hypothetical protein